MKDFLVLIFIYGIFSFFSIFEGTVLTVLLLMVAYGEYRLKQYPTSR